MYILFRVEPYLTDAGRREEQNSRAARSCRKKSAPVRQAWPDSGLGCQVKKQ